jgi:hypothetical protein
MAVTLPLWQFLSLTLSVFLAFGGFVFAVWKIVSKLQVQQVSTAADAAKEKAKNAAAKADENERSILRLRAELPLEYVRREDYIRGQTIIEAKLDALAAKIDKGGRSGC